MKILSISFSSRCKFILEISYFQNYFFWPISKCLCTCGSKPPADIQMMRPGSPKSYEKGRKDLTLQSRPCFFYFENVYSDTRYYHQILALIFQIQSNIRNLIFKLCKKLSTLLYLIRVHLRCFSTFFFGFDDSFQTINSNPN